MSLTSFTEAQVSLLPNTALVALQNTARVTLTEITNKITPINRRVARLTGKGRANTGGDSGINTVAGYASTTRAAINSKSFDLPMRTVSEAYNTQFQAGNDPISNQVGSNTNEDIPRLVASLNSITRDSSVSSNQHNRQSSEATALHAKIARLRIDELAAENLISIINTVLENRATDPTAYPEPEVNTDDLPSDDFLKDKVSEFITDNIFTPFKENLSIYDRFIHGVTEIDPSTSSMFDLVYGPPISTKGQFVLSEDGLYYDSRIGGLDPSVVLPSPSGIIDPTTAWLFNFPPNLGGRGKLYSNTELSGLANTWFNPDWFPDDEFMGDFNIKQYYDTDDVLETFEANKTLQVGIVSGHISELITSGYTHNSAMAYNYYSQINAICNTYDDKIKKRRKQLDLVAIFASDTYNFTVGDQSDRDLSIGTGHLIKFTKFEGEQEPPIGGGAPAVGYWKPIDRIPVNDFTFMRGKGVYVDISKQQELVIFSEDLEDTILPIIPKFLVTPNQPLSVLDKFAIAQPPISEWVTPKEIKHVSGQGRIVHNLVDRISTSGLILGYNFLKPNVVNASSNEFNLDNFAPDSGFALDAQLVGSSTNYVFPSGVAIPYLEGAFYNHHYPGQDGQPDDSLPGGSYVRLPSTHRPDASRWVQGIDLENLTYTSDIVDDQQSLLHGMGGGFSFDCWVHVPQVASMTNTHRYRLILANENTGRGHNSLQLGQDAFIDNARLDEDTVQGTYTSEATHDKVHGLIFGFRDAGGLTNGPTTSGLELILAPTVSQNRQFGGYHSTCIASQFSALENVTFNNSPYDAPSASSLTDLGLYVPSSTATGSGYRLVDTSAAFVHLVAVFDYKADTVKIYLDSEQLAVSSFSQDFCGSGAVQGAVDSLFLPNDVMHNINNTSQAYNKSWESTNGQGPICGAIEGLEPGFTPWILGGGYTDSTPSGFLGHNINDVFTHTSHADPSSPRGGQHFPNFGIEGKSLSGLGGYLGSFKMYARPLTTDEVLQNFNAQKGFFKNILT